MDTYNKYYNNKENKVNLKKYITKILLSIIFLLSSIIYIRLDNNNKDNYEKIFLSNSIPFTKINEWYQNTFGKIIPIKDIHLNDQVVFSEESNNLEMNDYLDGKEVIVDENYVIKSIESGLVVYIGDKKGYGNTVIIQGIDGVDIWYSNINTDNIKMYDYIKKDSILGNSLDNKYYLVFMKDNNYISYEEYFKD